MWLYLALVAPVAVAASADHITYHAASAELNRKLRRGYIPEAESVPHASQRGPLDDSLQSELDGVTSFVAQLPDKEVDLDPTSIEKMEKAVTDLVTNVDAATPMGDSVKQIKDLIKKTMLPKVEKAHESNQRELNTLASSADTCKSTRKAEERVAETEKSKYLKASPLHKACRTKEAVLSTDASECSRSMESTKLIRDLQCKQMEDYEAQWGQQSRVAQIIEKSGGETPKIYMKRLHETFCSRSDSEMITEVAGEPSFDIHSFYAKYLKLEKGCNEARLKYKGLLDGCKRKKATYDRKVAECDNLQSQMDGAACNRAVLIKDSCESYAECYSSKKIAFMNSKKAVETAVKDRKQEYRALKRMLCLVDSFKDKKVKKKEVEECKKKSHDTSHLDITYPELNPQDSCVVPNRYPATAAYKKAEFAPLPALAKGNMDAHECYGVLEISTKPQAGSPTSCKCERVTLNGAYSAGALVKCTDCFDVYRSKDKDSCPMGTKIFSPRSRSDWRTILASAPSLRDPDWIVDVTKASTGSSDIKDKAMNSETMSRWLTSDGSPWWLRSTALPDPGNSYDTSCYLGLGRSITSEDEVTFSAKGCRVHSKSYYCQQEMISTKPKQGSPEGCHCERVELTGRYSAGALLKCVGCLRVSKSTQKDSCPMGTKLFSPRSREDWRTVLDSVGPLRSPNWIVDVTRPTNGCGGCQSEAMNFETPKQATWRTQDGSPWWLRSTKYMEPSGDYKANCYMDLKKTPSNPDSVTFNDADCGYSSNAYYCQPKTQTQLR